MPLDNTKMLEFRQYRKSDKVPFITYADIQSLLVMSTMFTKSSIKDTENKHDVYKGKDCLKKKL